MRPLSSAPADAFATIRIVLTDMDDTLTWQGRLSAATYTALERLQAGGIRVVPVTAAPAGWCDQMARMWPVDGVIAENGGLFIGRAGDGHGVERTFWHARDAVADVSRQLRAVAAQIEQALPQAQPADDQPFRLASLAYRRAGADADADARLADALQRAGAQTTVNNLWVLGWLGDYDKRTMSLRVLEHAFGIAPERAADVVAYSGDSTNDAPMFAHFRHTVGVSTVIDYLPQLPVAPAWITAGPGGSGFVEFADALLRGR